MSGAGSAWPIRVGRRLRSDDVLATLTELMVHRGVPEYIRSDNGPEFTAMRVREWIEKIGAKTLFIEPGSPWENGYNESFNRKLRDEMLDGENLLHVEGSGGAYRGMEKDLQPDPAAQFAGLPAAGTRNDDPTKQTTSRCLPQAS